MLLIGVDTYFAILSFLQSLNSWTQEIWFYKSYRKLSICLLGHVCESFISIVIDLDKVVFKDSLSTRVVAYRLY